MLFYGAQVIHGIHGGVSAYTRQEILAQWNVIQNCHPWKSSPKMSDISCHVLHDVWPQKALFLRNFFHKTLPIIWKLYASASVHQWIIYGSLWGPPGHGSIAILNLDTLSEGIMWQIWPEFGTNCRNFKLIVGHINWSYLRSIILDQWPTDSEWPVVWLGTAFISKCMWRLFNYHPTMSSSCSRPKQEIGSHSIWPCLWRHKWIITTPSNELDTIKGSLVHRISLWSGHCIGTSCQLMLYIFMLFYQRKCVRLMRSCCHGNWCDITSLCRTQKIYTSWINEGIKRSDVDLRT